jgi:four helix bundle protein
MKKNREPGTGTGNREQGTGNREPGTQLSKAAADKRSMNGELRKGANISERLLELGIQVLHLIRTLPTDVAGRHVSSQLVRSSTSGGANYEEARSAESRADFIHKLGIAAKELRETTYWLRLIQRSSMTIVDLDALIQDTLELTAILMASSRTARNQ